MNLLEWLKERVHHIGRTGSGRTLQGQQLVDMVRRDYPDVHISVLDPREHPVVKPVEQPKQEPEQDDPWLHLMEEGNNGTTS